MFRWSDALAYVPFSVKKDGNLLKNKKDVHLAHSERKSHIPAWETQIAQLPPSPFSKGRRTVEQPSFQHIQLLLGSIIPQSTWPQPQNGTNH